MKTRAMTFMYSLVFLLIVEAMFLLPLVTASNILATVDIKPDKINLFGSPDEGDSPWVSAFIQFPKPYKKEVRFINISTVLLDGVVPASKGELTTRGGGGGGRLYKAYFDRYLVEVYLWIKIYHIGLIPPFKNEPVELTVTGKLYDETLFEGSDTILVSTK